MEISHFGEMMHTVIQTGPDFNLRADQMGYANLCTVCTGHTAQCDNRLPLFQVNYAITNLYHICMYSIEYWQKSGSVSIP